MCPVKIYYSIFQIRIAVLLEQLLKGGLALSECAVKTSKGTKAVDVAWASFELLNQIKGLVETTVAPEICVEILSESNTQKEMTEKRELYFEAGAKEVWLCSENGDMRFFNPEHELIHSKLVPGFPLIVMFKLFEN